jgi:cell division protein FtsW (lipid II flippase)
VDPFGYVSVIFSVVIGLGLSHLLTGVVDLVKARQRVRFYWVHLVWVAITFVGHVFLWWTMWNLRLMKAWNFFSFLLLLLGPVLLFVAAGFLVPKVEPDKPVDLKAYFYENRGWFFGTNATFTALISVENWLLTGRPSPAPVTATFAVWIVLLCVSAFVRNERYHAAAALLIAALFLIFIIMFGLRLGAS